MATLDDALQQFESVEANLTKLEHLWARIERILPGGPAFGAPPEYEALCFSFRRVLPGVPPIDGFRVTDCLLDYDAVGQMHLDAAEVGEIEAQVSVQNEIERQGRELREYRLRFGAKRRELVRDRLIALIDAVDEALRGMAAEIDGRELNSKADGPRWGTFTDGVAEIDTLVGTGARPPRWGDLQRHLHFGMVGDVQDIIRIDWPAVKKGLAAQLYDEGDPVPVTSQDLGAIVAARPSGPATTKLAWEALTDEDFERLLFVMIADVPGYENPQWLQKTHAPDRGRDLSVVRVELDPLGGARRYRTIVQCKHWLSRSVGPTDVADARSQMELWQPPRVDALVIATTGRFTADAIALIEQHNQSDRALSIDMWPDSHLERLLAARPHLIGQFRLRRAT